MATRCVLVLAFVLCLLSSASAPATPFTGTLLLQVSGFAPVSVAGSGSGDPTLPSISADAFVGSASVPGTLAAITQVFLSVTGNAVGSVGTGPILSGGGLGGLEFRGFGVGIPIFGVTLANVGFPVTRPFDVDDQGQFAFGVWRTGVATISRTHTAASAACVAGSTTCPTAMLGGATANTRYFGGAAQIVLVAALDIYAVGEAFPGFAVMALNYVPEPSTAMLLGSGALVLGGIGRRRQRRG